MIYSKIEEHMKLMGTMILVGESKKHLKHFIFMVFVEYILYTLLIVNQKQAFYVK